MSVRVFGRVFPYLRKDIVADVNKSDLPFSMNFDKTTTAQVKKHNEAILYTYILYSAILGSSCHLQVQ